MQEVDDKIFYFLQTNNLKIQTNWQTNYKSSDELWKTYFSVMLIRHTCCKSCQNCNNKP